jgi:DNA-binding response OmpR family regulator
VLQEYKPTILFIESGNFTLARKVKRWTEKRYNFISHEIEHQTVNSIAQDPKPDIVLLDPGAYDGRNGQFYNELAGRLENTPFIFLTANRTEEKRVSRKYPYMV